MFEPISRSASQDVFGFHSAVARKHLDSFSIFDWGRMPDGIPYRGRFHALLEAYLFSKITSLDEWTAYFRSTEAHQFRKAATGILKNGQVTASLNDLADGFPMKTGNLGLVTETDFREGRLDLKRISTQLIERDEGVYLVQENFTEIRPEPVQVLGKTVWDFSEWKKLRGPKSFPFEFECSFEKADFPEVELKCGHKTLSSDLTLTEALLICELDAAGLQELILRVSWIAGFIQYQLRTLSPMEERKIIRIRMGTNGEFVFLGSSIEFSAVEDELKKYYSTTIWGKVVLELQNQAKQKGTADWKRQCFEPAPWLDPQMKNRLTSQYQKLISGIASCLSE